MQRECVLTIWYWYDLVCVGSWHDSQTFQLHFDKFLGVANSLGHTVTLKNWLVVRPYAHQTVFVATFGGLEIDQVMTSPSGQPSVQVMMNNTGGVKPQFFQMITYSLVSVSMPKGNDMWTKAPKEVKWYDIQVMCPEGISRITRDPRERNFKQW